MSAGLKSSFMGGGSSMSKKRMSSSELLICPEGYGSGIKLAILVLSGISLNDSGNQLYFIPKFKLPSNPHRTLSTRSLNRPQSRRLLNRRLSTRSLNRNSTRRLKNN